MLTKLFYSFIFSLVFCNAFIMQTQTANAHATILSEQTMGDYKATMDFFGDAAFANEEISFTFRLLSISKNDLVGFTDAFITVTGADKKELFTGPLVKSEPNAKIGYTGGFTYIFPESGSYVLTAEFKNNNQSIAKISLPPLYVYAPETETTSAAAPTTTTQTENQVEEQPKTPVLRIVVFLVLVVGSIVGVLMHGKKK